MEKLLPLARSAPLDFWSASDLKNANGTTETRDPKGISCAFEIPPPGADNQKRLHTADDGIRFGVSGGSATFFFLAGVEAERQRGA